MKAFVLVIFLSFLFYGCSQDNSKAPVKDTPQMGQKFFDYDEIDYYVLQPEDETVVSSESQERSTLDILKDDVLIGKVPKNIQDQAFIQDLEKLGFKKYKINKSKFKQMDEIFRERKLEDDNDMVTACIPNFRDIFIFKNQGQVIGVARICFGCGQAAIIGTAADTTNFGGYGQLQQLLKSL